MNVALIDYGTGNLHSLAKAIDACGARASLDIPPADADAIILPGVGAFGPATARLERIATELRAAIDTGIPCLGICLGMQLLFDSSDEGDGRGLGLIGGRVERLHAARLPHMGWNRVETATDPLLADLDPFIAYYANTYVVRPCDESHVIAWTTYAGQRFAAAVRRGSVWGVQFHPEKSDAPGVQLIRNFLAQAQR